MRDIETTYAVDLSKRDEPTEAELKSASERIKRKFWKSLDDVTNQMISLALGAEKEDVRLRASSRILDEFSDRGKIVATAPVSVQILNAIPMDRAPVIEGKEAESLEWQGAKIALPKPLRQVKPDSSVPRGKTSDWGGDRVASGRESEIGFSPDPAAVDVPTLPARDNPKK